MSRSVSEIAKDYEQTLKNLTYSRQQVAMWTRRLDTYTDQARSLKAALDKAVEELGDPDAYLSRRDGMESARTAGTPSGKVT